MPSVPGAPLSPTTAAALRGGVRLCVDWGRLLIKDGGRGQIRERAVERAALSAAADPIIAGEGRGGEVGERPIWLTARLLIGAAVTVLVDETLSRLSFTEPALLNEAAIVAAITGEAVPVITLLIGVDQPVSTKIREGAAARLSLAAKVGLCATLCVAAISRRCAAVVAALGPSDEPVPTNRRAALRIYVAPPPLLDLAVRGAAIAPIDVPIITLFPDIEPRVATALCAV